MPESTERSQEEAHRLVLEIAEKLHGLNMLEAEYTLNEVRKLVFMTSAFDATGQAFHDQVEAYNEAFDGYHKPLPRN